MRFKITILFLFLGLFASAQFHSPYYHASVVDSLILKHRGDTLFHIRLSHNRDTLFINNSYFVGGGGGGANLWSDKGKYLTPTDSLNKGLSIKKFITVANSDTNLITATLKGTQNHVAISGIDSSSNISSAGVLGHSVYGTGVNGYSKYLNGISGSTIGTTQNISGVFGISSNRGTFGVRGLSISGIAGEFEVHPATNNGYVPIIELYTFTQGIAQNGLGGYLDFNIQSNGGALAHTGAFACKLTNANNGYESSSFEWFTSRAGGLAPVMSIDSAGILKLNNDNPSATLADSALARNKTTGKVEMRKLPTAGTNYWTEDLSSGHHYLYPNNYSTDSVAIGGNTPTTIFDVTGTIKATSNTDAAIKGLLLNTAGVYGYAGGYGLSSTG